MMLLRRLPCRLLLCAALLLPALVHAVVVEDLYETAQPVGSSQEAAFAEALRTVVIKVSGQRDAPARLGSALANPRQFVQRYGVTEDDVLQVGFDDVSIDRLLIEAGLPIWGRERPAVLVVLSLDEVGGHWASADVAPLDKERLEQAARARGLPLHWGTLDSQDLNLLDMGVGAPSALVQIATRNGANAVLAGRGSRAGGLQWVLATIDGVSQTTGSLEDGVHLAADTFAKVFGAVGTSLSEVNVDVSGIVDLDAYATTLNYLEQMTLVRTVAVEQVAGDTLRLRLAVRGDAETLQRAIALDHRLVPLDSGLDPATASAANRLALRYQP
jgi:hypothetical protein